MVRENCVGSLSHSLYESVMDIDYLLGPSLRIRFEWSDNHLRDEMLLFAHVVPLNIVYLLRVLDGVLRVLLGVTLGGLEAGLLPCNSPSLYIRKAIARACFNPYPSLWSLDTLYEMRESSFLLLAIGFLQFFYDD